jgi:hypothetical protein
MAELSGFGAEVVTRCFDLSSQCFQFVLKLLAQLSYQGSSALPCRRSKEPSASKDNGAAFRPVGFCFDRLGQCHCPSQQLSISIAYAKSLLSRSLSM